MPNFLVEDLSHYTWDDHFVPDFHAAKASGIVGAVHKATEGPTFGDQKKRKPGLSQAMRVCFGGLFVLERLRRFKIDSIFFSI